MMDENCKNCKYEKWDCKNCYFLDKDFDNLQDFFPNIIFTIVLTRQCNLRCNYCGIDFSDDVLNYEIIDGFIDKLKCRRKDINSIKFEFFGGEPTLEFDKIKYIVKKTEGFDIKYSIVTNGFLLDDEKMDFLIDNNFEIVFSVAFHTKNLLDKNLDLFKSKNLSNFIINFIIEPGKEKYMFDIFINLLKIGFKNITILPVYYTKKWSDVDLINLDNLLKKIKLFYFKAKGLVNIFYIRTSKEFEFNIKKNDIELFLDYDGKIYGDYDTELRLLKDFVGKDVFSINEIFLGDLNDKNFSLLDVILNRRKINTVKYINKITRKYNIDDNLLELGKVIAKNNVNLT